MEKTNKMGVMPVKKLIVTMSLPMMVSMLVQALYNVVDSIFVSRISEETLTAVTLAFPMQNLMIALASGTGVGINALLSRSLGEKKYDRANSAANMGLFLTLVSYVILLVVGIFYTGPFIESQTSNPEIARLGKTYLTIVSCCSVGLFFQVTLERLLQSTGKTIYSMYSQTTGAVINIIFDPIFIFGLGPFPEMGVAGAAYATILGQVIGSCIGLFCNIRYNTEIKLSFKEMFKPVLGTIKEIYYVGIPSIFMMSIGSIMTYFMNIILGSFSSTATAVFGVYFKLQSFFFMPVFGLNNGLIPVLAFNYGARNRKRIEEALRFSVALALSIMIAGTVAFQLIPEVLLGFFNASGDMIDIGVAALRIISISFPVAGLCIAMGSVFQAFSKSFYSLFVSVGRQLVVLIPAAWLLARTGILSMVWWAFPIAEVASLILSVIFFRRIYRNLIVHLQDNAI